MNHFSSTEYSIYQEILDDLLKPIIHDGLDDETLRRLYESKLVYLQNLRTKCFREVNAARTGTFTSNDFRLIIEALELTRTHLSVHTKQTIHKNLNRIPNRKVG